MKINLHSPIEEVQVQIIPLIDVIFCILTFFLLAALQFTRQQAINVDLPKANTGTAPQIQQRLIVTLDAARQIYIEQQPVSLEQLPQALRAFLEANPTAMLVLNASQSSSYNDVIQVLDTMRQIGGDRVALSTIPSSPDQPAGSTSAPGTIPVNPLGNPTPTSPSAPGQFPFPSTPVPQPTATPGNLNSSPKS